MRRAARWDGAAPIRKVQGADPAGDRQPPRPDAAFVREVSAFLRDCRAEAGRAAEPFDLLISGTSAPKDAAETVGPLAEAGATWWQECLWDNKLERAEPMLRRIESGPPQW